MLPAIEELAGLKQWVTWQYEKVNSEKDEYTKVPYKATGHASTTKKQTWLSYDAACKYAEQYGRSGIGFVFSTDDGLVGIDLDDCIDEHGVLLAWACEIVDRLSSYTEVSPSGRGLKIWVRGQKPAKGLQVPYHQGHIEIYGHARYFTLTARHLDGTPDYIADCDLAWLYALVESLKPEQEKTRPDQVQNNGSNGRSGNGTDPYAARAIGQCIADMEQAHEGTRNETLNACAYSLGRLIAAGRATEAVYDDLRAAARQAGLSDREIDSTIQSGKEAGMKVPNETGKPKKPRSGKKPPRNVDPDTGEIIEGEGEEDSVPLSELFRAFFLANGYHFRLNLLDDTVEVNGKPMTDVIKAEIMTRLYDDPDMKAYAAVENIWTTIAAENAYHPLKDYLTGVQWDETDHIRTLAGMLATSDAPITYQDGQTETPIYVYLKRWLVGAVAKVLDQKQNVMLVLAGKQDIGKSHLARWLCSGIPDRFIESHVAPHDVDCQVNAIRKFIWEVAELDATTRKEDVSALKAFITQEEHDLRKKYGRYPIQKPATASFIGTVNDDTGFLKDGSGNRRYMVVSIEAIDWSYKTLNADQLWAQAVRLYREGEVWRLKPEEKRYQEEKNKEYMAATPLLGYIERFFNLNGSDDDMLSSGDIAHHLKAMGCPIGATGRGFEMELSTTMKQLGIEKHKPHRGSRVYRRIKKLDPESTQVEGSKLTMLKGGMG